MPGNVEIRYFFMKEENKKILSGYRMQKAIETLKDANIIFKSGHLHSCVNRIYYSIFYAVNALLIRHGMYSAKHSGVRSLFNRELVNKGLISGESGDFYNSMFENRQEGDYKDLPKFERKEVKNWLEQAGVFIKEVNKVLKSEVKSRNKK